MIKGRAPHHPQTPHHHAPAARATPGARVARRDARAEGRVCVVAQAGAVPCRIHMWVYLGVMEGVRGGGCPSVAVGVGLGWPALMWGVRVGSAPPLPCPFGPVPRWLHMWVCPGGMEGGWGTLGIAAAGSGWGGVWGVCCPCPGPRLALLLPGFTCGWIGGGCPGVAVCRLGGKGPLCAGVWRSACSGAPATAWPSPPNSAAPAGVTLRLFGVAHFVHLATALSAAAAVLPLLPVAAVALPAVAELALLRGRPLAALALAALHVGAYTVGQADGWARERVGGRAAGRGAAATASQCCAPLSPQPTRSTHQPHMPRTRCVMTLHTARQSPPCRTPTPTSHPRVTCLTPPPRHAGV